MRRLFQYIRRQPKTVRDNYALGFASSITGIVFLFWFVSLPGIGSDAIATVNKSEDESPSPFATLIKQAKEQLASVRSGIANSTSTVATSTETVATTTIVLSEAEIEAIVKSLEENQVHEEAATSAIAVPVLSATTSATGTTEGVR